MQYRLAENELTELEARLAEMRAMLNGMLARPADALLVPPRVLPEPRPLSASDADLIAVAVDRNPELASLRTRGGTERRPGAGEDGVPAGH